MFEGFPYSVTISSHAWLDVINQATSQGLVFGKHYIAAMGSVEKSYSTENPIFTLYFSSKRDALWFKLSLSDS